MYVSLVGLFTYNAYLQTGVHLNYSNSLLDALVKKNQIDAHQPSYT